MQQSSVIKMRLGKRSLKVKSRFQQNATLETGDHETEVTRPKILHDVSNIEHPHHNAPHTSDLEHQIEVTEPITHDAANLENQTEMTEPDMHTATDTANKENRVPNCQHKILKQRVVIRYELRIMKETIMLDTHTYKVGKLSLKLR